MQPSLQSLTARAPYRWHGGMGIVLPILPAAPSVSSFSGRAFLTASSMTSRSQLEVFWILCILHFATDSEKGYQMQGSRSNVPSDQVPPILQSANIFPRNSSMSGIIVCSGLIFGDESAILPFMI